jgi:hypothetical protein
VRRPSGLAPRLPAAVAGRERPWSTMSTAGPVFDAFGVLHRGRARCKTVLRNFGGNAFGVSTEAGTPSNFSASILKAARVKRLVDSAGSTSKSRSLCSVSVPVKTDPKRRGRDRPWRLESRCNSARCAARAWDGFIGALWRLNRMPFSIARKRSSPSSIESSSKKRKAPLAAIRLQAVVSSPFAHHCG